MAAAAAAADLQFKMAKKVAQLTKVIYHLNTKNDDHDAEMKSLTELYEAEIRDILKDAAAKVRFFKEKLEDTNPDERTAVALKELQRQHEKEREDALRGFEQFKKAAKANEARLQQAAEQRVQALTQELATLRTEFAQRLQQFDTMRTAMEAKLSQDIAAATAGKTQEVDQLVKTYNEKYKAMLAEQLSLREAERAEQEAEFEKRLKSLQLEQERKVNGLLRDAEKERERLLKEREAAAAAHSTEVATLQERLAAAVKEAERLRAVEMALTEQLTAQAAQLGQREGRVRALEEEVAELQRALAAAEEQGAASLQRVQVLEAEIEAERQRALAEMGKAGSDQARLAGDLAQWRTAQAAEAEARKRAETEAAGAKAEVARLNAVVTAMEVDATRLRDTVRQLEGRVAQLEAGLQSTSSTAGEERGRLLRQVADLQSSLAAAQAETEAGRQALGAATEAHQRAEDHARAMHTAALQDQRQALTAEAEALRKALLEQHASALKVKDQRIAQLESELNETRRELRQLQESSGKGAEQLADRVRALEAEKATAIKGLEDQLEEVCRRLEERQAQWEKELAAKEEENTQLTDALGVVRQRLAVAEETLRTGRLKEQQLTQQLAAEQQRYEAERRTLQREHEEALARLQERLGSSSQALLAGELQALRKKLEAEFSGAKQQLEADLTGQARREREALQATWQRQLGEATEQVARLEKQLAEAKSRVAALERELQDAQQAHQLAQRQRSEEAVGEAQRLEAERKRALAALEERLRKEFAGREAELRRQHDDAQLAQLAQLQTGHREQLAAVRREADGATQRQREELLAAAQEQVEAAELRKDQQWETVVAAARDEAQAELLKKEQAFQKELNRVTGDIHGLKQGHKALEAEVAGQRRRIEELQRQLAVAGEELQRMEQATKQEAAEHRRRLEEQEAALKEKHGRAMAAVVAENKEQTLRLKAEFDRVQGVMQHTVRGLEAKLQELEAQYENRESRQEDLLKINHLISQVLEKEQLLAKLQNQLKFYKLELENREENYNHMFKRQPNVMNGRQPVATSQSAAARAGSLASIAALPLPVASAGGLSVPPLKKMAAK